MGSKIMLLGIYIFLFMRMEEKLYNLSTLEILGILIVGACLLFGFFLRDQ